VSWSRRSCVRSAINVWSAIGRETTRKTRKESHSSTARGSQERLAKARRVREGRLSRLSRSFVGFVVQTSHRAVSACRRDKRLDRDRPRNDAKAAKAVTLEYRPRLPGAARQSQAGAGREAFAPFAFFRVFRDPDAPRHSFMCFVVQTFPAPFRVFRDPDVHRAPSSVPWPRPRPTSQTGAGRPRQHAQATEVGRGSGPACLAHLEGNVCHAHLVGRAKAFLGEDVALPRAVGEPDRQLVVRGIAVGLGMAFPGRAGEAQRTGSRYSPARAKASASVGAPSIGPCLLTARAPTALAKRAARGRGQPRSRPTTKAAS
jgi:hypothetical protein